MNTISNTQIEQYKTYFKQMNIAQYGAGVLLNALNEGKNTDPMLESDSEGEEADSIFSDLPATVNINSDSVYKKVWDDLENEIKEYECQHLEIKGQYVIAINADTETGQPEFTIASKTQVLGLVSTDEKDNSDSLMTDHPVQIFKSTTISVKKLTSVSIPGLDDLVSGFLQKNRGVFQFLSAQQNPSA